MKSYIAFVVRFRYLVLTAIALVTLAASLMITQAVLSTSLITLFLGEDSPDYIAYRESIARFGNDDVIIVGVENGAPLSQLTLERMQRVHERLEAMDAIERVGSVANLSRVVATEDGIAIRKYADEALADPGRVDALVDALREDPVASGLLVSADGKHFLVLIELIVSERSAESGPELIDQVLATFTDEGFEASALHRTGIAAITAELIKISQSNIVQLFPVVLLILLLTVLLMFGRFWPVVVTSIVALIAVTWTMGFSILLDRNVHILMSIVPGVVLIISFSDVIHLCSAYLIELSEGKEKSEAINCAGTDVGTACLLTSATTGVGFLALSFIPTPVFQHFGLVLGVGVAIALLLAMTLSPIIFTLMKAPSPWRAGGAGRVQDVIDSIIEATSKFTDRRPRHILVGFAVFTLICLVGISRIEFENYFDQRLAPNNPVRQSGEFFDAHFLGTRTVDIYVDAAGEGGLLDPETFHKIAAFSDLIEAMPEFERTLSIIDLMESTHLAILPGDDAPAFLPTNAEALAQYLILLEMDGPDALAQFIDFNRRSMRITATTRESGIRSHFFLGERIEALALEHFGDEVKVNVTGVRYLLGGWISEVIDGQRRGLIFSVFAITLLMIFGLRSWRAGSWSMLPNLLPLIALGGWVGLFWDDVDTDTFIVAMIAIGIGVDDTIHFLMRLRIESARTSDVSEALHRTFHFAGRAIFITTAIFTLGFLPFLLSDYFSIHILGTLLPLCFVVALVADFLFLPALVRLGLLRF
ncbi:MAG: MMPL family transporter [Bradymonadaceae bacterium]|nr:MMPL family transporter [Lujinxingiaceae bacterium]